MKWQNVNRHPVPSFSELKIQINRAAGKFIHETRPDRERRPRIDSQAIDLDGVITVTTQSQSGVRSHLNYREQRLMMMFRMMY